MSTDFLQFELRLMIARYGRKRMLEELARLEERSIAALEKNLEDIEKRSRASRKKKDKSTAELVADASEKAPHRRDALEAFVARYEQKIFLPELRHVKKFLIDHDVNVKSVKTRKLALPHVLKVLATVPETQLRKLFEVDTGDEQSDLSILAGAILGSHDRE